MDDLPVLTHITSPTAARPLLGMTVLVVEDSLYACDAMRLMCLHSGARIRRADCLRSARRHLQVYRPSVVIIDLGLPDGSGLDLIEELAATTPRVASILGASGMDGGEAGAIAAGADGFIDKPLTNLGVFQQTILATLPCPKIASQSAPACCGTRMCALTRSPIATTWRTCPTCWTNIRTARCWTMSRSFWPASHARRMICNWRRRLTRCRTNGATARR